MAEPVTERPTIDNSRYRMAATIVDLYDAGEPVRSIADEWFDFIPKVDLRDYVVELIVAAHDRMGRYEKR